LKGTEIKKVLKKVIAVIIIMSMLLPTSAFASEGKTVEVKGSRDSYWNSLSEEERAKRPSHFSVSNVIDTFDVKKIDQTFDEGLIVYPSSKITLLFDSTLLSSSFKVYPLTKIDDTNYEFYDGEELPISGPVRISLREESGNGDVKFTEKIIDISEVDYYSKQYEDIIPVYAPGCSATLTEPGDYYVVYTSATEAAQAFVKVIDASNPSINIPPMETSIKEVTALPTASPILVNGTKVEFDAYNIDGNNYFKLRDIALAVNTTSKQFGVNWDAVKNAINLTSGSGYSPVGGELAKGDGITKYGTETTSQIYKDGELLTISGYNINNNNYFKLRDLGKAFNIEIDWDNDTQTVVIDTTRSYTED
jgi:hypothetical protein